MPFDASQVLVFGSMATFLILLWRFVLLQQKAAREMRAAALRGLATAMGTQFWKQGNPYQDELARELSMDPNWIVHTLRWPNAQAEIFSFQEVRRGNKGRIYYHTWIGYRFGRYLFPKFQLNPKGVIRSIFQWWRRRISLTGQLEFTRRYLLKGNDKLSIEQFFIPDRCAAVLSQRWPAAISSRLVEHSQQYDNLSQIPNVNREQPWWDRWVLLLVGVGIVILILVLIVFLGELWDLFDKTILKTEIRRYLFAILFFAALWTSGEWLIRFYRQLKYRAASRLEAQFRASQNRS